MAGARDGFGVQRGQGGSMGANGALPFQEAGEWLVMEGRFLAGLEDLLGGLVARVRASGTPLLRAGLHIFILHPQIVAMSFQWWEGGAVVRVDRPRYSGWERAGYGDSPLAVVSRGEGAVRRRLAGPDAARDFPILLDLATAGGTDYYAQPLVFGDGRVGASLTWCTRGEGGFSDEVIAAFDALCPLLATLCELHVLRGLAHTIVETYLGRTAGRRVLAGTIERGQGELAHAVVWYCDLRGFTARAEGEPASAVIALLNAWFERMAGAVQRHGGEVLKFIGDGMLALFPVEDGESPARACVAAIRASREAGEAMDALDREIQAAGGAPVRYGIALHLGEVTWGNIGAPDRLDFTVIGPAVNQAARLEGLCRVLGSPVLATGAVAAHVPELEPLGSFVLRGIEEPQDVWAVR